MERKTIQNNWIKGLRSRIARESEEWIKSHITKYFPPKAIAQFRNLDDRLHEEYYDRTMACQRWISSPESIIEIIDKYLRLWFLRLSSSITCPNKILLYHWSA